MITLDHGGKGLEFLKSNILGSRIPDIFFSKNPDILEEQGKYNFYLLCKFPWWKINPGHVLTFRNYGGEGKYQNLISGYLNSTLLVKIKP